MTFKPVDSAIVMVVGPCIDDIDFKTLEEAISYDAAGMDVSLMVEKTNGTTAVTVITLTTGGASDWTHKDGGYYEIEVTAAQNVEEGVAYIRGICTGVLPFESPRYNIVKANVYDSLIKGTDNLQTDVTQLAGAAQSLTDLKDFADAGYDPATNKVQGVVTVDTTTTNIDMVGTDNAALASVCTEARLAELDAANLPTDIADVPTVAEFEARTIAASDYFDPVNDAVANVTLVTTTTTNTDMVSAAPTATANADAVWDEAISGHVSAGSFGAKNQKVVPSETVGDYKATGFSIPNEYDTVIAALQTDLDNPAQYKADISTLATSAALTTHDGKLDAVDGIVDAILVDTGTTIPGTIATVQADLDNPTQYKADISTLAIEANVQTNAAAALTVYDPPTRTEVTADKDAIIAEVNANEAKIDTIDSIVDSILIDTSITLESHLTDIKGTGFTKDINSLPQCLTAVGFSTHDVSAIQTALEADDGKLYAVYAALLNKMTVTSTLMQIYKDDASTLLNELVLSDNGTTVTRV